MTTPTNLEAAPSRKKKRVLGGVLVGLVLLLGVGVWRRSLDIDPQINIPSPTLPAPNAYDYYAQAVETNKAEEKATSNTPPVDRMLDTSLREELSPQQLAARYPTTGKEAYLASRAPALKLLRQGFGYPYRQPPARDLTAPGPDLAGYRQLTRLLIVESHARAERGNWAGASRSLLDILHLGQDTPRGGGFIASLVGSSINALGRKEFDRIVPHLDAAEARHAALQIENLEDSRFGPTQVLEEEKWIGVTQLLEIMKKDNWRATGSMAEFIRNPIARWKLNFRLQFLGKRAVIYGYINYLDALIARHRATYKTAMALPPLPRPSDPINKEWLPEFDRTRFNLARDATDNRQLATMLALCAFRLEHGHYPTALQQLVPRYLKHIPTDPFGDAEPLHYKIGGNTYLLYSIGPDGVDDGGQPIDSANGRSRINRYLISYYSKGDVVAGINR